MGVGPFSQDLEFETKGPRSGLQLPSQEVLWVAAVRLSSVLEGFLGPVQLAVGGQMNIHAM